MLISHVSSVARALSVANDALLSQSSYFETIIPFDFFRWLSIGGLGLTRFNCLFVSRLMTSQASIVLIVLAVTRPLKVGFTVQVCKT